MINSLKLLLYKLGIVFTDITISLLYLTSYVFLPFTKVIVTKLLSECDIQVNGNRRSDPKVVDNRFFCLIAKYSYTGFVDAYEYGYFECGDVTELFMKICRSNYYNTMCYHPSLMWRSFFTRHFFLQTDEKSVGKAYDEGGWNTNTSDEKCETVSTGYWKNAKTCEESYDAKHDLIARKLKLKTGMRVIDLGCGEGSLCKYLAENYDVEVIGVNVSKAMIEKAQKFSKGLKITFKVMDARRITGKYDRITCIGMIEHFGTNELRQFFETVHRCLSDDGIFLLEIYSNSHPLAPINDGCTERMCNMVEIYHYYLDVLRAFDGLFIVEDCQNLRIHSGINMKKWVDKTDSSSEKLTEKNGEKAIRGMKAFYAEMSALHFCGQMQAFQLVFSKNGLREGYDTVV